MLKVNRLFHALVFRIYDFLSHHLYFLGRFMSMRSLSSSIIIGYIEDDLASYKISMFLMNVLSKYSEDFLPIFGKFMASRQNYS